jgi:hypothetical protein
MGRLRLNTVGTNTPEQEDEPKEKTETRVTKIMF